MLTGCNAELSNSKQLRPQEWLDIAVDPPALYAQLVGLETGCRGLKFAKKNYTFFANSKIKMFCKFLAGSFSAVSKRNFAKKYAFDNIFQALQDLHTFAALQSQNFSKKSVCKISNFRENLAKILPMLQNLQNFAEFQNVS